MNYIGRKTNAKKLACSVLTVALLCATVYGMSTKMPDGVLWELLQMAIDQEDAKWMKGVIKSKVDVNEMNEVDIGDHPIRFENGQLVDYTLVSPLMYASYNGFADGVRLLVKAKADVNAANNHKVTALMYAADCGHTDIVDILIKANADVNAQDEDGRTALMYATDKGHAETADTLIKANADVNTRDNDSRTALMHATDKGYTDIAAMLRAAGANE